MKQVEYRRTAGSFKHDDFDVVIKIKTKEYEAGGVEVDFEKKRIVIKSKEVK